MSSSKRTTQRPGRRTKGPFNSILPQDLQGHAYVVKSFIVQPRITLLAQDGKEENELLGPQFGMFEAQMDSTIPEFLAKRGVKLRSGIGE